MGKEKKRISDLSINDKVYVVLSGHISEFGIDYINKETISLNQGYYTELKMSNEYKSSINYSTHSQDRGCSLTVFTDKEDAIQHLKSSVKHIDAKQKENSSPCIPLNEGGCVGSNLYNQVKGFEKGFQKAIELMGDKKFSEEDIQNFINNNAPSQYPYIAVNLARKQTEFDVEIEMEFIEDEKTGTDLVWGRYIPKLDADGCLIIKHLQL